MIFSTFMMHQSFLKNIHNPHSLGLYLALQGEHDLPVRVRPVQLRLHLHLPRRGGRGWRLAVLEGEALEELVVAKAGGVGLDGAGGELLVEVGDVGLGVNDGHEHRLHLLPEQLLPVDGGEPGVRPEGRDVLHAFLGRLGEQFGEEVLEVVAPVLVEEGLVVLDAVEQFGAVLGVEGRQPVHELVDDGPQAPPVHRLPVALLLHHLRRQVLGRPAHRKRVKLPQDVVLGQPEVGELDVAIGADEHVLGLELLVLVEALALGEESEELPALAVLEHQEDLPLVLEGGVDADEEGVRHLREDVALHHHPLHLVLLLDVLLLHRLDRQQLPALLTPHQDHLRVGTLPDHRQHRKCVQGRTALHSYNRQQSTIDCTAPQITRQRANILPCTRQHNPTNSDDSAQTILALSPPSQIQTTRSIPPSLRPIFPIRLLLRRPRCQFKQCGSPIIYYFWMSAQLDATRKKLEELKARRANRPTAGLTSEVAETRSEIRLERREYSLQKSDHIHVSGSIVETYDMEIQCALETRSLDSRPAREVEAEQKEVDLLLPREHKQKRRDNQKEEHPKEVHELSNDELNSVIKSRNFTDFFNRSSKFLEKVLDHGDGDMIELLLREGLKTRDRAGQDILAQTVTFTDSNYTANRVITDLDWSPQINELFLASYSQNEEGSIKDHVGLILLWNPTLKNRAEFYCFGQSAVTSAKFFPFSNSTVLGGCYNGQILLWDIRAKSMPVQRSGISADAHKYPVCSLSVVGTQIANNVVSYSNDGMMCIWDIKQFSKPTRMNKLSAGRSQRAQPAKPALNASLAANRTLRADSSLVSNTSSILDRTNKEEVHDINITCCRFPLGDANNYYIGSLNGVLYKNALHNKANEKITLLDEHNGPISGLSINNPSEFELLNNLVLTSSYDWTVKLWHPDAKDSLRTFENSEDYIYDVNWHPNNPSLFATVNNDGFLDIFDLTRDLEMPIAHEKVSKNAQNRCIWNTEGSAIISGDSSGAITLYGLAEKYRRMENSKYEDLERYLKQKPEND